MIDIATLSLAKKYADETADWDKLKNRPFYNIPEEEVFYFSGIVANQPKFVSSKNDVYYQLYTGYMPPFSELSKYAMYVNGEEEYDDISKVSISAGESSYVVSLILTVFLAPTKISDTVTLQPGVYFIKWDAEPTNEVEYRIYRKQQTKHISADAIPGKTFGEIVYYEFTPKQLPEDIQDPVKLSEWLTQIYGNPSLMKWAESEGEEDEKGMEAYKISNTSFSLSELKRLSAYFNTLSDGEIEIDLGYPDEEGPTAYVDENGIIRVLHGMILVVPKTVQGLGGTIFTPGIWIALNYFYAFFDMGLQCFKFRTVNKVPDKYLENPNIVPAIPDTTKNYVLKSIAGTLTWVEETTT